MSEPTYLHTWGSRRHILDTAAPKTHDRYGTALCGQLGETEDVYFKHAIHTARRRQTILNRPVCARCAALAELPADPRLTAEAALLDAVNLLPPERWHLLRPETVALVGDLLAEEVPS